MTGSHFSSAGIHKTASCKNSHPGFTQFRHYAGELDSISGTKLRPKSRLSRDQVIFPPPTQLATRSPTQLHKISSPNYYFRFVTEQVGEQVTEHVASTNHREHRDIADEITNLPIHHKPCDKSTAQQMIDTICYPMGNELNTALNPQPGHITGIIEVNYDN